MKRDEMNDQYRNQNYNLFSCYECNGSLLYLFFFFFLFGGGGGVSQLRGMGPKRAHTSEKSDIPTDRSLGS